MTVNDIVTIITTVGFPIVCCGAMAWYVKYITDKNRDDVKQMREEHKEEMTQVTSALNNNTLALQHLADKLGA